MSRAAPRKTSNYSVFAIAEETSPTGDVLVHRSVSGRLAVAQGVSPGAELVTAVLAHCAVSQRLAARVHACLGQPWAATATADAALSHMDSAFVATDGEVSVHTGTLAFVHDGLRLSLPVPCAFVTGDGIDLRVHASERHRAPGDDNIFYRPFGFMCAAGTAERAAHAVELPCGRESAAMPRHAAHRVKRIEVKQQHVQALHALCLHETGTYTNMSVLEDATMVCHTQFTDPDVSVVSYHMLNV